MKTWQGKDLSLPKVREGYLRNLDARARLMDEGIDVSQTLPRDRSLDVPLREGHGSVARRLRHLREGETPCVACQAAEHAYRYPDGEARPFGWTFKG